MYKRTRDFFLVYLSLGLLFPFKIWILTWYTKNGTLQHCFLLEGASICVTIFIINWSCCINYVSGARGGRDWWYCALRRKGTCSYIILQRRSCSGKSLCTFMNAYRHACVCNMCMCMNVCWSVRRRMRETKINTISILPSLPISWCNS